MERDNEPGFVWVFNGDGAAFPSGVFTSKESAEEWISKHALSGVLTGYPLGQGTLDWAVMNGTFKLESSKHASPVFIQRFTSGAQPHHHFEDGIEKYR